MDLFQPYIVTGKYLLIANKTNGMIYYFSNKKEIANKVIDGNIENVYIASDGRFVVQYTKDSGYKKVIAMYDKKAKLKYNEAYITSMPIIGIEFLPEEYRLLVVQADSSNINIGTSFNVLDYTKEEQYSNLCIFNDKLVYNYKLINNEIIYISDSAVESYNIRTGVKKEIHSLIDSQTNYIALYNNYFVTVKMNGDSYEMTSRKFDDTIVSASKLSSFPKYIEMNGLLTYIISENSVEVINKWGVLVDKIDISLSPKKVVVFNNEKTVALIFSNKVEIVSI